VAKTVANNKQFLETEAIRQNKENENSIKKGFSTTSGTSKVPQIKYT